MKRQTQEQLKQDVLKINEQLKNNILIVKNIVNEIDKEIKKGASNIEKYENISSEIHFYFRMLVEEKNEIKKDEHRKKIDENKAKLKEIENAYIKAYDKKINLLKVKKYYNNIIDNFLKITNNEIALLFYKYNINNTRDFNILKNEICFVYGDSNNRILNKHLIFYSYVNFGEYEQNIKTALKTNENFIHCEKTVNTSFYKFFTNQHGQFLENFSENIKTEIINNINEIKNNIKIEIDYKKVLKNILMLEKMQDEQKTEIEKLKQKQSENFKKANIYNIDVEILKN